MIEILAGSPLLTLFLVIALGTLAGAIPLGPLRLGPAGALFVGLAVGALDPRLGEGLALVQSIGLALFVYTIGIAAGATFFRDLRHQASLMLASIVLITLTALTLAWAARMVGLDGELTAGIFAGGFTSTPALAAATSAAHASPTPAVAYSIAYPIGVVVTMIAITLLSRFELPGHKDPASLTSGTLRDVTVHVTHPMRVDEIPGIASLPGKNEGSVRVSYLMRGSSVSVAGVREQLRHGDYVHVVGEESAVHSAIEALGHVAEHSLAARRDTVDFRRFLVSNPALAGASVADLHIPARFGAIVTRIKRGDADIVPNAETSLRLGDRVRVVYPVAQRSELRRFFGDSETRITEVDFFATGIGIALGIMAGLLSINVGGASIALGAAAGPLIVGLILGRIDRTGPLVWTIPTAATLTIRQLGLVLFLATVGLMSGQAFARTAFTATGATIVALTTVVIGVSVALYALSGWALGQSSARTAGALAGYVGQPALLAHAHAVINDARLEPAYSSIFTASTIVKIILAQLIVVLIA